MVLDPADIVITTFRPEGRSGLFTSQEIGVRIVHTPTGLEARASDDRSVHKNKAIAMGALVAMLELHELDESDSAPSAKEESKVRWQTILDCHVKASNIGDVDATSLQAWDAFAAAALMGILTSPNGRFEAHTTSAKAAASLADALMEERIARFYAKPSRCAIRCKGPTDTQP